MKLRICSALVVLCMMLCLIPMAASARGLPAGTGTEDDPYLIYTAQQLKTFRDKVNGGEGTICAKLMNDIVLNDGTFDENGNYTKGPSGKDAEKWTPIGVLSSDNYTEPEGLFKGTFDGGGYTVRGLYIDSERGGFFGTLGDSVESVTVIRNLTVTGYVSGRIAAGIASVLQAGTLIMSDCMNRCTVRGEDAGGILSVASGGGTIRGCYNTGTVQGSVLVGGIAGQAPNIDLVCCGNAGAVTDGSYQHIGGIAASANSVTNCYNVGRVSRPGAGIEGSNEIQNRVKNSYWWYETAETSDGYAGTAGAAEIASFANGEILAKLQNEDPDNPWTACGYLAAAERTVPLLHWMTADSHTHNQKGRFGGCTCGLLYTKGTEEDPYLIFTAEDLKAFAAIVGEPLEKRDACAKLADDIVLNDGSFDENGNYTKGQSGKAAEPWTPIESYRGTFDGDGHMIRGLYVNAAPGGLFGALYGRVKNVGVTGCIVYDAPEEYCCSVGAIASWLYNQRIDTQDVGISGCANYATVIGLRYEAEGSAGGIAGILEEGTYVTDCANYGLVKSGSDLAWSAGGIVGTMNGGAIRNCYNIGTIQNSGQSAMTGAIAGSQRGGEIKNCYWPVAAEEKAVGKTESGTTTKTAAKTKSEFANAAVLTLLQNEDPDSPWTACGYLAAAERTVPLLHWMTADAHEHAGDSWLYDAQGHWKVCTDCEALFAKAAHSGTDEKDCTRELRCDACGFVIKSAESAHSYPDTWTAVRPGTTHGRSCKNIGCEKTESASCSGGTASCTETAKCALCGESYGEPDPNNHTDLRYFPAAAATKTAEGNLEYWCCTGCGKYFADEDGAKEITLADTVTVKLPEEKPTAPKTADAGNVLCWLALMLVSGGALGATAVCKQKKHSRG